MYESFYGLKTNPFRLAPDPNFFFESSGHKRGLAYLRYGLHQAQGFVIVTGVPGTGKSMLVQTLLSDITGLKLVVASLTSTNLGADDILQAISMAFDIFQAGSSKASMLAHIEEFLIAQAHRGRRVLLIVDEAQNLPPTSLEELRMLSNFQLGDQSLLQTILLGQQQLKKVLESPDLEQLTQRVIASCHLRPLEADETRSYIRHRLSKTGWKGDPSFSGEALRLIHFVTQGIPRRINIFCDRMLLAAYLDERHEINDEFVRSVIEELHNESAGSSWSFDDEAICSDVELLPLPNGDMDILSLDNEKNEPGQDVEPSLPDRPTAANKNKKPPAPAHHKNRPGTHTKPANNIQPAADKRAHSKDKKDKPVLSVNEGVKQSISQKLTTLFGIIMAMGLLVALYYMEPDRNGQSRFPVLQEITAYLSDIMASLAPDSSTEQKSNSPAPKAADTEQPADRSELTPEKPDPEVLANINKAPAPEPESINAIPATTPAIKVMANTAKPSLKAEKIVSKEPQTATETRKPKAPLTPSQSKTKTEPLAKTEPAPANIINTPITSVSAVEQRLTNLLSKFSRAYEGGDFGGFIYLFSDDAIVDESEGKQNIANDYRYLFKETEKRTLSVKNMDWQEQNGIIVGEGDFNISVWEKNSKAPMELAGKIEIEVVEINKRLMIYRLFHRVEF